MTLNPLKELLNLRDKDDKIVTDKLRGNDKTLRMFY